MLDNLRQQIEDAIRKELPEEVGSVLRKRLEKADKDSASLKDAQESCKSKQKTIDDLNNQIFDLKSKLSTEEEINNKLAAIKQREEALKITLLEKDLNHANSRNSEVLDLVKIVFKEPKKVTELYKNTSESLANPNYNAGYNNSYNSTIPGGSKTETCTITEKTE